VFYGHFLAPKIETFNKSVVYSTTIEQRTLRAPRKSINHAVDPLQNASDNWSDNDSPVTNPEEEPLDSHPLTPKPAPVTQLRTAPPGISKGASSRANASLAKYIELFLKWLSLSASWKFSGTFFAPGRVMIKGIAVRLNQVDI
jgi:hypothetical protein